jgi:hypothetical protein
MILTNVLAIQVTRNADQKLIAAIFSLAENSIHKFISKSNGQHKVIQLTFDSTIPCPPPTNTTTTAIFLNQIPYL